MLAAFVAGATSCHSQPGPTEVSLLQSTGGSADRVESRSREEDSLAVDPREALFEEPQAKNEESPPRPQAHTPPDAREMPSENAAPLRPAALLSVEAPHESGPIEKEKEHLERAYSKLDNAESKGMLAQAFVTSLVRPYFQLSFSDMDAVEVSSVQLDNEEMWTVLWINYAGLEHLLVVLDADYGVRDRVYLEGRARMSLRDVVGDRAQEIFVDRILGSGLSTYPSEWSIYRVNRAGKLRRLLTHKKSHSSGAKFPDWAFMNHFYFEDQGKLSIRTVHSECPDPEFVPRCPSLDSTETFAYSAGQDRYLKLWQPAAAPAHTHPSDSKLKSLKPTPRSGSKKPHAMELEF